MTLEKKIFEHQCKISQAETWSNLIHREQLVAHHGPKFSRSNEIVEILKEISVRQDKNMAVLGFFFQLA